MGMLLVEYSRDLPDDVVSRSPEAGPAGDGSMEL